jgi:hypothetical protein
VFIIVLHEGYGMEDFRTSGSKTEFFKSSRMRIMTSCGKKKEDFFLCGDNASKG